MSTRSQAVMVGALIGGIAGIGLYAVLGAILVRFATGLVAKFTPSFGMAYTASLIGGLIAYLIGFTFVFVVGQGHVSDSGSMVLSAIVLVVYAVISSFLVKKPETGRIGFAKGMFISLAQMVTIFAAGAAFLALFLVAVK